MDTPKYLVVQEWIRSEINKANYINGDKIPSENDLMEKFGFSRQTIRLAISNLESQGYLEKIKGSGTYVNIKDKDSHSTRETRNIGVILRYLDTYSYPDIIKGLEAVLTQNGYNISLGITNNQLEKETALLNSMIDKKVDGLIIEGCKTAIPNPNKDIYYNIKKEIPCLFINGCYPGLKMPVICLDDIDGGSIATNFLINMGHKNIATVFNSDDVRGLKRYEGYTNALLTANIPVNDHNALWYTTEDIEDDIFEYRFKQIYTKRFSGCSAIICYNDNIALKIIDILKSMNIKPFEEVSIISFDNSTAAENNGLTSVGHIKSDFGSRVAECFIKQLKTGVPTNLKLKSELIIRDSVKKRAFANSWGDISDISSDSLFE